jgi:predicted MFS family arabinose efflux permease
MNRSRMTSTLTGIFAVSGGVAVGNLYLAQPLLGRVADDLNVPVDLAGLLVTMTQLGYALGVLLIVPLGDVWDRRRLISAMMLASALALGAAAWAPAFVLLALSLAAVGLTTVAGQLLTPLAGDLASDQDRGRVVGSVASGLLIGILLSRAISGVVADWLGWRAIFGVAALVSTGAAVLLWCNIPPDRDRVTLSYGRLLGSVFGIVVEHRAMRVIMALGATTFGVFTMYWTGVTFLLSAPPYSYGASAIGATSLLGLVGALAARGAGHLYDRGHSVAAKGVGIALALLGILVAAFAQYSLMILLLSALLVSVAIQVVNVLNQTRVFEVDPVSRSRLNTAFVAGNFLGGAAGSTLASVLWRVGGWQAIIVAKAVIVTIALAVWFVGRGILQPPRGGK